MGLVGSLGGDDEGTVQGPAGNQDQERKQLLRRIKANLGDLYPNDLSLQQLEREETMSIPQLRDRKKQLDNQLNRSIQKVPETEEIPTGDFESQSPQPGASSSTYNDSSVRVNSISYQLPDSAAAEFSGQPTRWSMY